MSDNAREAAQRLRQAASCRISESEAAFLRDIQAFIEFALQNGLTFSTVVGGVGHDINEVARCGFDLAAASRTGFRPKSAGYALTLAQEVGQSEERD